MARAPHNLQLSPVTAAAIAFVGGRRSDASRLGIDLADLVDDPEAFVRTFRHGSRDLVDETYRREQSRIAPGLEDSIGIRLPLLTAIRRAFDRGSRWAGPDSLLWLADRLLREDGLEIRVLAFGILTRVLPKDPERGWQMLRRASRDAHEWITVDTLAHVAGRGIMAESYRWAELEQLVYSPSRWERRLVGSTVATIPFTDRAEGRTPDVARRGLALVGDLVGDAEPDVQKALSWALRSLAAVELPATVAFLRAEASRAAATADGHRAWVVRDTFGKLPALVAAELAATIAGVRKRPGAPSTSRASATAADFLGAGIGVLPADRPIVTRS